MLPGFFEQFARRRTGRVVLIERGLTRVTFRGSASSAGARSRPACLPTPVVLIAFQQIGHVNLKSRGEFDHHLQRGVADAYVGSVDAGTQGKGLLDDGKIDGGFMRRREGRTGEFMAPSISSVIHLNHQQHVD